MSNSAVRLPKAVPAVRRKAETENPYLVGNRPGENENATEKRYCGFFWNFRPHAQSSVEAVDSAKAGRLSTRARAITTYFWTGVGCIFAFLSGRADAQTIDSFGATNEIQSLPAEEVYSNESPSSHILNSGLNAPGTYRTSLAGWQSYNRYLKSGTKNGSAGAQTARLGPVKFTFGAGLSFALDSNINNSPDNPLADGIVTTTVDLGMDWQITERNDLQLSLGFEYAQYLIYSQYNDSGLDIAPDTSLDYRVYFGDMVLSFYDDPSITNGAGGANNPAITNSVNFRQLTNSGGLSLLWNPNQLTFLVGLERMDTVSLTNDAYSSQNSVAYSAYGSVSMDLTPTTRIGIRSQVTSTTYSQDILNNGITTKTGVLLQSTLSNYTTVSLEAGMQTGTFTDSGQQSNTLAFQSSNGVNTDVQGTLGGGNYVSPYFEFTLSNRLNRYFSHSVGFSHETIGSGVSNSQQVNTASYQIQYRLNRLTRTALEIEYQHGGISNSATQIPYSNWQISADVAFEIAKNTSIGLSYDYYLNELSGLAANYNRQVVTFSIFHNF